MGLQGPGELPRRRPEKRERCGWAAGQGKGKRNAAHGDWGHNGTSQVSLAEKIIGCNGGNTKFFLFTTNDNVKTERNKLKTQLFRFPEEFR